MAGNLLEITITYQRKLRLETFRAMGSGKIARVVFVNRMHAILVAELGFEMLPLLAMRRSETMPEISIMAETTKQSHKTSVSHLLRVPDRALLVRELRRETSRAIVISILPNISTFEIQEIRHSIETSLIPEINPSVAEAEAATCTMEQPGHSAKPGTCTMISTSPETAEESHLNPSGNLHMAMTIAKAFVTAQTIGTTSLQAFVITETIIVIAIRIRCHNRITGTTLDTEMLRSVSPMHRQDMFVTHQITGTLSLWAIASIENTARSLSHITKTVSVLQRQLIGNGSETESLFPETEKTLMFLLAVKSKISLR
jgi:hypothetical protein